MYEISSTDYPMPYYSEKKLVTEISKNGTITSMPHSALSKSYDMPNKNASIGTLTNGKSYSTSMKSSRAAPDVNSI